MDRLKRIGHQIDEIVNRYVASTAAITAEMVPEITKTLLWVWKWTNAHEDKKIEKPLFIYLGTLAGKNPNSFKQLLQYITQLRVPLLEDPSRPEVLLQNRERHAKEVAELVSNLKLGAWRPDYKLVRTKTPGRGPLFGPVNRLISTK